MLVVGLGNPGREYVGTRHNIGRDLLIELAERENFADWKHDSYVLSYVSSGQPAGVQEEIKLALPETYMNRSGEAVRELVKNNNLSPEDLVVVYDDIDLPVGSIKISKSRGSGGHNGVQSIIDHLKTNDFVRIRIGICPVNEMGEKNKPTKTVVSKFVLARFSPLEKEKLDIVAKKLFESILSISQDGIERAMNTFNTK